jgi:hypothetical protein
LATTGALIPAAGCAAAAVPAAVAAGGGAEEIATAGILLLLAEGVIQGFGQQLSDDITNAVSGFAHATIDAVRRAFDNGAPDIWAATTATRLPRRTACAASPPARSSAPRTGTCAPSSSTTSPTVVAWRYPPSRRSA